VSYRTKALSGAVTRYRMPLGSVPGTGRRSSGPVLRLNPTASCIASRHRIKPSSYTTPICLKSGQFPRSRMEPSMRRHGRIARQAHAGRDSTRASLGSGQAVTATSTSISVTAEAAQAGGEIKPPADAVKAPAAPSAAAQQATSTPLVDVSGVEKSAVTRSTRIIRSRHSGVPRKRMSTTCCP